jgi:hypothetical protein
MNYVLTATLSHAALRWTMWSREVSPYFCTLWAPQIFSVNVTGRKECCMLLDIIYNAQAATAAWYKTTKSFFIDSFFLMLSKNFEEMISFVMSVRPSVCMQQLGSDWTDFHEIWYFRIFRKYVEKIRISLTLARIMLTLHEDPKACMT